MRGLAIAAVLMYHLNRTWVPNGFVGVDIFFVISGFVVASSAATFANQSLLNFSVEFYKRRIKRLLPQLQLFLFSFRLTPESSPPCVLFCMQLPD